MRLVIGFLFLLLLPAGTVRAAAPAVNSFAVPDDNGGFFSLLDLDRPGLARVKAAVQAGQWPAAQEAWAAYLQQRTSPRWLWSRRDKAAITRVYDEHFHGLASHIPAADKVLARQFDFQGVAKTLGHDPDWGAVGGEWTNVLNRHEYLDDLGYAYWATNDPKYAADFVFLLTHWIADNPVPAEVDHSWKGGIAGWRTLETGIRAQGWFDLMELFMDAPAFDARAKCLMTRSLVEQARRLYVHNAQFHQGNWQVNEAAGLAAVGIMLPEFREAAAWRQRAFAVLVEHMQKDVYPDGAHWEVTPGYDGWVTRQFLRIALLARENGYTIPGLLDRHEKMFDFLMTLTQPDGLTPSIGDTHEMAVAETLGFGAIFYHRPDFHWLAGDKLFESDVWTFGPDAAAKLAAVPSSPPSPASALLPDSRFAVMRTGWARADKYLLFNAAPWGGGHNHRDRMEVVVYAGRPLLVDPGIYSYNAPLSTSYFRTSEAHNVVLIDGKEQPRPPHTALLAWHSDPHADFVSGEVEENDGMKHRRSVLFVRPDYWVVVDHVYGTGTHDVSRLFHFALGDVTARGEEARSAFPGGTNLAVRDLSGAKLQLETGWIPTGAATAAHDQVADFDSRVSLPAVFCTVLVPFNHAADLPTAAVLLPSPGPLEASLRLTFPGGRTDRIVVAPDAAELQLDGATWHGHALAIREAGGKRTVLNIP